MSGTSHHQVDHSWTKDFLAVLRKDYVPLTRHTLLAKITEIEKHMREQVAWAISVAGYVAVAVDGGRTTRSFPPLLSQ